MTRNEPARRQGPDSIDDDAVETLNAADLRAVVERACEAFAAHRDEIDALNVFPVPDGDTGTNLLLTVRGALEQVDDDAPVSTLAREAVLAARGNSGVIFSQVLRALSEEVDDGSELDGDRLAAALDRAREYAYETISDPVEGTMLTAISEAARAAAQAADSHDLAGVVVAVRQAVRDAVEHTVDQLDVLREAGVVDAGARGFEVFWLALHAFVTGRGPATGDISHPPESDRTPQSSGAPRHDDLEYRFEVQYLLDGQDIDVSALREALETIGDSVAVVDGGDVLNVHVHTNDVGVAIEAGIGHGRPRSIEVTHFGDQIAQREHNVSDDAGHAASDVVTGVVAVLPGPGLEAAGADLGAVVVRGGGGDLPSVADILNAVGQAGGETILVLPGHANVVPAARQAAEVSRAEGGRDLVVVDRATSVPAVLAALAVFDPTVSADAAREKMTHAAGACRDGAVVPAVRDADTPSGAVSAGDHLAVVDGDVVSAADDAVAALVRVAQHLEVSEAEVVTLVVGAEVSDTVRGDALARLAELAPDATVEVIDGEQHRAAFYLGVE